MPARLTHGVDHFGSHVIGKGTQFGHIQPAHVSGHLYPIKDRCRQLQVHHPALHVAGPLSIRHKKAIRPISPAWGVYAYGLTGGGEHVRPALSSWLAAPCSL
jgi:hypothetical protein